ncbi:MAG: helix-turn-helix domain-containing protein [Erysipelotrichaceae bacterium]
MDGKKKSANTLVKYFHFIIHDESTIFDLEQALSGIHNQPIVMQALDNKMGYFQLCGDDIEDMANALPLALYDMNVSSTFLISHETDRLTYYSLLNCIQFGMNRVHHLSDVLMMMLFKGDIRTRNILTEYFYHVDRELIHTANEFLKSGLNANKASAKLYLHRNTLSYRLQKFIQSTNLDIRDYYNAQVLYIYLISTK